MFLLFLFENLSDISWFKIGLIFWLRHLKVLWELIQALKTAWLLCAKTWNNTWLLLNLWRLYFCWICYDLLLDLLRELIDKALNNFLVYAVEIHDSLCLAILEFWVWRICKRSLLQISNIRKLTVIGFSKTINKSLNLVINWFIDLLLEYWLYFIMFLILLFLESVTHWLNFLFIKQFVVEVSMLNHVVFFQTAGVQIRFKTTFKNAFEVSTTRGSLVNLNVLFEIRTGGKLFLTVFAFKRFLAGMDSLVAYQVWNLNDCIIFLYLTYLWKCLLAITNFAFIWPLFIMDSGMFLKRGELREGLITCLTTNTTN